MLVVEVGGSCTARQRQGGSSPELRTAGEGGPRGSGVARGGGVFVAKVGEELVGECRERRGGRERIILVLVTIKMII